MQQKVTSFDQVLYVLLCDVYACHCIVIVVSAHAQWSCLMFISGTFCDLCDCVFLS